MGEKTKFRTFLNGIDRIIGGAGPFIDFISHSYILISAIIFHYLVTEEHHQAKYFTILIIWMMFNLGFVVAHIKLHNIRLNIKQDQQMKVRYSLLGIRRFTSFTAQRLADLAESIQDDPSLLAKYNFESFVRHVKLRIIRMIFYQVSFGNTDLDIRFRVALMEPNENNELKIISYYNSERRRPRVASRDIGFQMKEGVAGWAWYYMQPFCIDNVAKYLTEYKKGTCKGEPLYFIENFPEDKTSPEGYTEKQIQSIIAIPVVIQQKKQEKLKAVVCIDSDKENAITNYSEQDSKILRIHLYPYIRLLELVYASIDFIHSRVKAKTD